MAVRATGPVEEDFREGKLREWVAHMFNRTNQAVVVELRVFDVGPGPVELLGFANRVLNPNSGGALLISKRGREVTWAQIEHSLGPDDVIVNFHGKTRGKGPGWSDVSPRGNNRIPDRDRSPCRYGCGRVGSVGRVEIGCRNEVLGLH